jgi:beta-glucosidase
MTIADQTRDAVAPASRPWLDAALPTAERVELLLAEMTLGRRPGSSSTR